MSHFSVLVSVEQPVSTGNNFECEIENAVTNILAPYDENSDDITYFEFVESDDCYANPNAQWDWWQVGGRWESAFLVHKNCNLTIYDTSEKDKFHIENTPVGYCWVAGARKSDIQWDRMRELELLRHKITFPVLEDWFLRGIEPEGKPATLFKTSDGILQWNNLIYKKGDTLNDYLNRVGVNSEIRFPCKFYAFIASDGWHSQGEMGWFGCSSNNKDALSWNRELDAFIDSVPDDYVLISVDCHI